MSCPYHRGNCAYPEWSAERCEYCHCGWGKITAPATHVTTRLGVGKNRQPIAVENTAYLDGYGEMTLNHLWRHATDEARTAANAAKRRAA